MKNYCVYILTNKTNTVLYVGVTNDIKRRIFEHKENVNDGFTAKYNVNKLVYCEFTSNIESAIEREKQLKKWNREKKIKLIEEQNPEWKDLVEQEYL